MLLIVKLQVLDLAIRMFMDQRMFILVLQAATILLVTIVAAITPQLIPISQ